MMCYVTLKTLIYEIHKVFVVVVELFQEEHITSSSWSLVQETSVSNQWDGHNGES